MMVTVYRKSAKGQHEIETRATRLAPRLRTALILVDGRRNDTDLRSLVQVDPDGTLLALLEAGYIEVVSSQAPAPPAGRPPEPASRPPAPVANPVANPTAVGEAGLLERRRQAVRSLTDQLGPIAEVLSLRIEKSRQWDDLRPLLEQGQRLLQSTRGAAAAAAFGARFLDLPPT